MIPICREHDKPMKLVMVTNDNYLLDGEMFIEQYECEITGCNNYTRIEKKNYGN